MSQPVTTSGAGSDLRTLKVMTKRGVEEQIEGLAKIGGYWVNLATCLRALLWYVDARMNALDPAREKH